MIYGRIDFTGNCDNQDRGLALDWKRRFAFRSLPKRESDGSAKIVRVGVRHCRNGDVPVKAKGLPELIHVLRYRTYLGRP